MTTFRITLIVLLLAGCSSRDADILSQPVASGGTLADHASQDSSVILLIRPSDSFTCGNHISRWQEWGRKHPGRFLLVFTREPTDRERKQLLLYRIRSDAVLAAGRASDKSRTPYEYLITNRRVARAALVEPGVPETPLLSMMEQVDRRAVAAQGS